jgi:hypothetical protein
MRSGRAVAGWIIVALAGAVAGPAAAAGYVDSGSGFAVDPPQGFIVAPAKSPSYDLAVIVNSLSGSPSLGAGDNYLCQVGFKALPESADFTQEEINLQVAQPDWVDNAAAALSQTFNITVKQTFVLDGATGIELVGKPKDPAHASGVFISMVDTPKGRTTLNCATRPEEIDGAVNQFRLIRTSITPPGTMAH